MSGDDFTPINGRIRECLSSPDPVACLTRLFEATNDGMVAKILGDQLLLRGDPCRAVAWFERAEALFPMRKYQDLAHRAAAEARAMCVGPEPPPPPPTETLYNVSCSKRKVWQEEPSAETYVPAGRAYRGSAISQWRSCQPYLRSAPWLILSAKYGFIEPDHPIHDYDVTFSIPSTGPVDDATLAAQVAHQTRWTPGRPLNAFSRVRVLGSATYLERVRRAFGPGVDVATYRPEDDTPPAGQDTPPVSTGAEAVAAGLRLIPADAWRRLDEGEPEWPVLEAVAVLPPGIDVLTALALGLTDYQLGPGGAALYWDEVSALLGASTPRRAADIHGLIEMLVARPVAALSAGNKLDRIRRFLGSGFPEWLAGRDVAAVGAEADECWRRLAGAMNQSPEAKTVAFAMKVLDLLHLSVTGRYMLFDPEGQVIPSDVRIAQVSFASGLLAPSPGHSVTDAMAGASDAASSRRDEIVAAWREVSRLCHPTSVFRIDSLVWQVAASIDAARTDRAAAEAQVASLLRRYGADAAVPTLPRALSAAL